MIITHFPKTLGGVSFEKLVNYMRERKPFFSIKRFPLPHTPTPSKRTTKGGSPLETPNLCFSFYFSSNFSICSERRGISCFFRETISRRI